MAGRRRQQEQRRWQVHAAGLPGRLSGGPFASAAQATRKLRVAMRPHLGSVGARAVALDARHAAKVERGLGAARHRHAAGVANHLVGAGLHRGNAHALRRGGGKGARGRRRAQRWSHAGVRPRLCVAGGVGHGGRRQGGRQRRRSGRWQCLPPAACLLQHQAPPPARRAPGSQGSRRRARWRPPAAAGPCPRRRTCRCRPGCTLHGSPGGRTARSSA